MKFIGMFLKLIGSIIKTAVILAICSSILFVAYKGNQTMTVPQVSAAEIKWELEQLGRDYRHDLAQSPEPTVNFRT